MQKILLYEQVSEIEPFVSKRACTLLHRPQLESFIGIDKFNLVVFNWYDQHTRL